MIDIHAHILPDLDDGPLNLAESVRMVKEAEADGITTIFATPHACNGVFHCTPEKILEKCALLSQELENQKIEMHIRPGSEVHLTNDTISNYDQGNLMTLNNINSHLLLELPSMFIIDGALHTIRQLRERGVTPVIAHPERNKTLTKNLHVLPLMIEEGALTQLTATSLTGGFGKKIMRLSEKMIDNNLVTLIASDIHPFRKFMMRKALRKVLKTAGRKTAEMIFQTNPEKILYFSQPKMNYGKY